MRRAIEHLLGVGLVAGLVVGGPSVPAQAAPTCLGKPVTHRATGQTQFTGTPGNDVILGTPFRDLIDGAGGNDRICGLGEEDIIEGGLGNDRLSGGDDADLVVGDLFERDDGDLFGQGNDILLGGPGQFGPGQLERLIGDNSSRSGLVIGGGDDVIDGGSDGAVIIGDSEGEHAEGGGDDVLTRGGLEVVGDSSGTASVIGSGDDKIELVTATVRAIGDSFGNNDGGTQMTARGTGGDDVIVATNGDEELVGDHFNLSTNGFAIGAGNDVIKGKGGQDDIFGDSSNGRFTIGTTPGDDSLSGGGDGDTIRGGPGNDGLNGGEQVDVCRGEAGTDAFTACETALQ